MQQASITPTRRRRSSGFSSISSFHKSLHSRKSSMHSLNSPHTPYRPSSAFDRNSDYGFGIDTVAPERLDNLAAELAEEDWDEEADSEEEDEESSRAELKSEDDDIHPDKIISSELEQQLRIIEALSKQDTRASSKGYDAFERVGEQLRDLNSQLKVEEQATRLVNTSSNVSTDLYEGDRYLKTILQTYLSQFASAPDLEEVEALVPMFVDLASSIPAAPTTPLPAIHALATSGNDILASLAVLSDNVYIAQQQAALATQKLRSVQDIIETIRRELRDSEAGLLFLENGAWDDKLRRREAAAVCSEVVGGFEKVCETWRRRLGGDSVIVPG